MKHTPEFKLSKCLAVLVAAGLLIGACAIPNYYTFRSSGSEASPTIHTEATLTAMVEQGTQTQAAAIVTPVVIGPALSPSPRQDYSGWATYTNVNYGFSFRFPPDWQLVEQKEANFVKISQGDFTFVVGYRWIDEDVKIVGGSATPGELKPLGAIRFFTQELTKIALVHEEKIKTIYYNGLNAEIPASGNGRGLIFSLRLLASAGANYNQIDVSQHLQEGVDRIIASFERISSPGQALTPAPSAAPGATGAGAMPEYRNSVYGFTFQYPPSWSLQEEAHLIKLSQGTLSLLIGVRRNDEQVNLGPDQVPPGTLSQWGFVRFFGYQVPRQVLNQDGRITAVFYNGPKPIIVSPSTAATSLEFVIILYDYNPNTGQVNIPAERQAEADRIVESFRSAEVLATPASPATAVPPISDIIQGSPTWKDSFDSSANWYMMRTQNTSFDIANGSLTITVLHPNTTEEWGVANVQAIKDFYLEASFRTDQTCAGKDRYGLLFRAPDPARGYVTDFSCDGSYRIYLWDGKNFVSLQNWTFSGAIESGPGRKNIMGILAQGESIHLYANGSPLMTVKDATFGAGIIGLVAGAETTENFKVFVEDVAYWVK